MITNDERLIRRILESPDVVGGFFEDESPRYISGPNVFYLYSGGCLFPSKKKGRILSMHAAIPKHYRGKTAIASGKKALKWALNHMDIDAAVSRVKIDRVNVQRFSVLCGMQYIRQDEKYKYYGAINGWFS